MHETFTFTLGGRERQMLLDALEILSPDRPSLIHMRDALHRRLDRLRPNADGLRLVASKVPGAPSKQAVEDFLDAVMPSLGGAE